MVEIRTSSDKMSLRHTAGNTFIAEKFTNSTKGINDSRKSVD